jgi:hypothetical protein
MKLYRGYQDRPKMLVGKVETEWNELNAAKKAAAEGTSNPVDIVRKMGEERFARWGELAKIAGAQFFTDDEAAARGFAGEKGFLIIVDIPDEDAHSHYRGDQMMMRGGGEAPRLVSNFVFSGKELAQLTQDGHADFVELEIEKKNKEGKVAPDVDALEARVAGLRTEESKKPESFHTIRGNHDLSEGDRKAIGDLRTILEKRREGKPPSPTEGTPPKI